MTIFSRDVDTGVAKWVYQMTPHDEWDYDGVNEMILRRSDLQHQAGRDESIGRPIRATGAIMRNATSATSRTAKARAMPRRWSTR